MKKLIAILTLLTFQTIAIAEVIPTKLDFSIDSNGSPVPGGYAYFCRYGFHHQNPSSDSPFDASKDKIQLSVDHYNYITGTQVETAQSFTENGRGGNDYAQGWNGNFPGTYPTYFVSKPEVYPYKNPEDQSRYTSISFELGTSNYGAEWFIDICHFRIAANSNNPGSITSIVSATNGVSSVADYVNESNLTVWGETSCDGQSSTIYSGYSPIPTGLSTLGLTSTTGNEIKCVSRFRFKELSTSPRIVNKGGNFSVHTDYEVR